MKCKNGILLMSASLIIIQAVYADSYDSTKTLPAGSVILDHGNPIKTFDELSKHFQGKAFFIDHWAPWCSPCIQEFDYVKPLHDFLKKHDIEIVYLNSDTDTEYDRWVEVIRKYNLLGYHLKMTWELRYDMKEKGINTQRLPQYLIVDKNGNVLENNALRPSSGTELYNQILNLIKL